MSRTLRNVSAIAGKELRSYFGAPVAWVLMGFFAVVFGYFYNVYLDYFVRQAMQSQFGPPQPFSFDALIERARQKAAVPYVEPYRPAPDVVRRRSGGNQLVTSADTA